jgi:hypothetical protein
MSAAWRAEAVCAESGDAELFDPLGEREPVEHMVRRARVAVARYCAVCPVVNACRQEAQVHEYLGVWGGLLRERRHVRNLLASIDPAGSRR